MDKVKKIRDKYKPQTQQVDAAVLIINEMLPVVYEKSRSKLERDKFTDEVLRNLNTLWGGQVLLVGASHTLNYLRKKMQRYAAENRSIESLKTRFVSLHKDALDQIRSVKKYLDFFSCKCCETEDEKKLMDSNSRYKNIKDVLKLIDQILARQAPVPKSKGKLNISAKSKSVKMGGSDVRYKAGGAAKFGLQDKILRKVHGMDIIIPDDPQAYAMSLIKEYGLDDSMRKQLKQCPLHDLLKKQADIVREQHDQLCVHHNEMFKQQQSKCPAWKTSPPANPGELVLMISDWLNWLRERLVDIGTMSCKCAVETLESDNGIVVRADPPRLTLPNVDIPCCCHKPPAVVATLREADDVIKLEKKLYPWLESVEMDYASAAEQIGKLWEEYQEVDMRPLVNQVKRWSEYKASDLVENDQIQMEEFRKIIREKLQTLS